MLDSTKELRMSAQQIYKLVFSEFTLQEFIYWIGYKVSEQGTSELKMSKSLEKYCDAKYPTIRRWINGQAKPNGTNMLMLYGGILSDYFDGNQEQLLVEFIRFIRPDFNMKLLQTYS